MYIYDSELTSNSLTHRHFPELRKKTSTCMFYYHDGTRVCQTTFLFLHSIGAKKKNVKTSVKVDGILPRRHGNLRQLPKLSKRQKQWLILFTTTQRKTGFTFLIEYLDSRRLTFNCCQVTKKAVWSQYCQAVAALSPAQPMRQVSYCAFLLI